MEHLFFVAGILIPLSRDGRNRHWLIRAKQNLKWRVLERLGPRDALVEMAVSSVACAKDLSCTDGALLSAGLLRAATATTLFHGP